MASSPDFGRISKVKLLNFCLCNELLQAAAVAAGWWVTHVIPTYEMGLERIQGCTEQGVWFPPLAS